MILFFNVEMINILKTLKLYSPKYLIHYLMHSKNIIDVNTSQLKHQDHLDNMVRPTFVRSQGHKHS